MDIMLSLRERAQTEEIDYLFVMNCLSAYRQPRDKLTQLIASEHLIRIKKGLYVFGKKYRKRPFSLEILANQIYGPSYISFEYALSYYGLIPEKVTRVTSACTKRIKKFETPVADFIYYYISNQKYSVGITLKSIDESSHFLIATKEKALSDYVARLKPFSSREDLLAYLTEGMRITKKDIMSLCVNSMLEIAKCYQNRNVSFLCEILQK